VIAALAIGHGLGTTFLGVRVARWFVERDADIPPALSGLAVPFLIAVGMTAIGLFATGPLEQMVFAGIGSVTLIGAVWLRGLSEAERTMIRSSVAAASRYGRTVRA
jgi:hypothetical protein